MLAVEKWQALSTILEAFGNSPSAMNSNATRFSHILSLDFDQAGQVASASIQVSTQWGKETPWKSGSLHGPFLQILPLKEMVALRGWPALLSDPSSFCAG